MTQSEVAALVRTAVYIVVGIPIPAGAAAAVFFLPHSRSGHGPFLAEQMLVALTGCCKPGHAICSCSVLENNWVPQRVCRLCLSQCCQFKLLVIYMDVQEVRNRG